jgi:hypothetical protein
MLVIFLIGLSQAAPREPCATPLVLSQLRELGSGGAEPRPPSRGSSGEPDQERDAFGALNSYSSEHFVLRWGTSETVPEEQVEVMLESLETAWQVQVVEMAHPTPQGAESYRFNVYVANTGVEGPWGPLGDYGAAGWFYPDDGEGYPFMVLALETMADLDAGGLTGAHELYHAIQYASGRYREEAGAWLWESTATWVEAEVFPESTAYARFLYGYALLPHLPIDYYAPFKTGALDEYHSYGAFLFPRMLSEHVDDWSLIRDVWVDPEVESEDPLDAIALGLEARGRTLSEVFREFGWRSVAWDYEDGEAYAANIMDIPIEFESKNHRFTEEHTARGTLGWDRVPSDLLPGPMGTNLLRLEAPAGDVLYARVQTEEDDWISADLVLESDGMVSIEPLLRSGNLLELDWPIDGSEERATLVVSATDRTRDIDSRSSYFYQLTTDFPDAGLPEDTGQESIRGCGCGSSSPRSDLSWLTLLGLSALLARRR